MGQIAADHSGKIAVSRDNPDVETIYVAPADGEQTTSFRELPPQRAYEVKDLASLATDDIRQLYQVDGSSQATDAIFKLLDSQGVSYQKMTNLEWTFLLAGTELSKIGLLAMCICGALTFMSVILRAKAAAIRRLNGSNTIRLLATEASMLGRTAGVLAILVGCLIAGLAVFTSIAAVSTFVRYWLLALVAIGASQLVAFAIAHGVLRFTSLPDALKGKMRPWPVLVAAFAIKAMALCTATGFIIDGTNLIPEWQRQENEASGWNSYTDGYVLAISGARDLESNKASAARLADLVRTQSSRGSALYAKYLDEGVRAPLGIRTPQMTYNRTAAERSIQGPLEQQLSEVPQTECALFVPRGTALNAEQQKFILSEGPSCQRIEEYDPQGSKAKTWEMGPDEWIERAELTDPIILVLPNTGLPGDRNLSAAVTQGDVVFTGSDFRDEIAENPELSNYVLRIDNASSVWAKNHEGLKNSLILTWGGALISAITVLFCAVMTALIVRQSFARKIFVTFAFGRSLTPIYWRACVLDVLTAGAVLWYLCHRTARMRAFRHLPPGAASPSQIAYSQVHGTAVLLSLALAAMATLATLFFVGQPQRRK